MNIKKIIIAFLISLTVLFSVSLASDKATIPDFDIYIKNKNIAYESSLYPFLTYKGITYFPMTYDYCNALNIATSYVEGEGLFIAHNVSEYYYDGMIPEYEIVNNTKTCEFTLPQYDIYVNGRKIDNSKEEYPIFNFRNITYFPLTYAFSVEDFNWTLEFTGDKLTINSNGNINAVKGLYIEVAEEKEEYAVLSYTKTDYVYSEEFDSFVYDTKVTYKRLDYETGEITPITEYIESKDKIPSYEEEPLITSDDDGNVYYGKTLILENDLFHSFKDSAAKNGYTDITHFEKCEKIIFPEATILSVDTEYMGENESGRTGGYETYLYVLEGDTPIYLGKSLRIYGAEKLGNATYITARRYVKTIVSHFYGGNKLYKLENGEVSLVNDLFSDFGSMEVIGKANGKLYLKCLWAPNENQMDNMKISPYTDGIFTFDGEKLERVSRFINTTDEIVAPNGTVYGILNLNGRVTNINQLK